MEKLNFFEKQSNDYFYIEMYKMYNELNDMVISQLDENDILYNFKIQKMLFVIENSLMINDYIKTRALRVHDKLPKKIKSTLRDRKNKLFETLIAEGWNSIRDYKERRMVFLNYASLFNAYLLNVHNVSIQLGDTTKLSKIKDYSLYVKAYKKLNDNLFLHINGSQYLNEYEIECHITVIDYILDALKKNVYTYFNKQNKEIEKHKKIEDYFNSHISINDDCTMSESDIALLNEHNDWKALRVKYLQMLFPTKVDRFPHNEAYFVRNKMMYNDKY